MSFFDFFKSSGESWNELIGRLFVDANDSLTTAFSSSNIDESWWAAVVGSPSTPGMLSTWLPVIAAFAAVVSSAQIVLSAFRGSGIGILRGGIGAVFSIPMMYVSVILIQLLSAGIDAVTSYIMLMGATDNANVFMRIFGVQIQDGEFVGVNSNYRMWADVGGDGGTLAMVVPVCLAFIIWLMSLFLSGVMALRSLGVVILASMAGWAVTALSSEFTKGWFSAWLKVITGLLLAKPFAAAVLVMSSTVFNHSDSGAQFFAGFAGLVIAICMPFAVISFISFTSAGAVREQDQAFGASGSMVARGAVRGGSSLSRIRRR